MGYMRSVEHFNKTSCGNESEDFTLRAVDIIAHFVQFEKNKICTLNSGPFNALLSTYFIVPDSTFTHLLALYCTLLWSFLKIIRKKTSKIQRVSVLTTFALSHLSACLVLSNSSFCLDARTILTVLVQAACVRHACFRAPCVAWPLLLPPFSLFFFFSFSPSFAFDPLRGISRV